MGNMELSIMTFRIMELSIVTSGIMTLSITAFSMPTIIIAINMQILAKYYWMVTRNSISCVECKFA